MMLESLAMLVSDPQKRARMVLMAKLENEMTAQASVLGAQFEDCLVNTSEVQRAVRVQIDLWSDEHKLNQQERLHLFRLAHRVAKVPQF